jgi:tRNA-2-methylthio-N6-dimethylallyladenosine synthase
VDSPKTFAIRTFGCQMNEHDSERLAGLLAADGLVPATSEDEADVIVLNTCCIRENADNKLYGTLGHLKSLKDARPGMQIAVGGCLAQKDREVVLQKAGWVDVVFGTHNIASAPGMLRRAVDEGPQIEILDSPDPASVADMVPALNAVRELPWAAWMTIQVGCDNSCAFCIVPSVRGGEISRPFQDLVHEATVLAAQGVTEITLLGQNVNSYGRDLTKRRPLFADLLRAVGGRRGHRAGALHEPAPERLASETIAAMAETAGRLQPVALAVAVGVG